MPATESVPTTSAQPVLSVVSNGGELVELRGTPRGKTVLSLADLTAKVSHYPEKVRGPTNVVQAFLVQHCDSNIEQLRALAIEALKIVRAPEYFSNWLKGQYFRGGGGQLKLDGQGVTSWLDFCDKLAEHDRVTRAGGKLATIITGTVRAIEEHVGGIMDLGNPCRIGGVCGPTGSQRTAAIKHIVAKHGGYPHASYMNCGAYQGVGGFKRDLADLDNCKVGNVPGVIDREIAKQWNPKRVLFIDNIQRAFRERDAVLAVFEFLIRLQEDRNMALYLMFTKDFKNQLTKGTAAAHFEQLVGRFGGETDILDLPDYAPKGDLRTIAKANGIESDAGLELLIKWSRQPGRIRVVFKRLFRAKQFAKADGKDRLTVDILKEADLWVPPYTIDEEDES